MVSLTDIQKQITTKYVAEMAAIGETVDPSTWSITSLERLFIYVFAYCSFVLQSLFETFKTEVDYTIANKNPHRLEWYANTIKAFQYGYDVDHSTFQYNNTGISDSVIAASKIIAYCAVTEEADSLNVKVAKDNGTDLEPLNTTELNALRSYMEHPTYGQKDAGVFLTFISDPADSLKLGLEIYFNPTILDENGVENSSGKQVVKEAIKTHLKNLPFNGVFALQTLVDILQMVSGVIYVKINSVQVKADGATSYSTIDVYYIPNSGYLRLINDSDLTLTFTADAV